MAVAGQLIAGKYRLEQTLGAGGMGSVWLATHLELGSKVAVKFQLDQRADSSEAVARFRREARAAAQLRSAHVVHIYDYGLDAGVPYIAMEFLAGESLRARLERDLRLAPSAVTRIVLEVAEALDVAHAAGVIHRDIKPSNLFIASEGRNEVIKLLDFGIAKWTDPRDDDRPANATTGVVGSAAYMSPEQARGQPLDHRTDLWSLAVVSYEMLTGRTPFGAPSIPATIRKLELGAFEAPSSLLGVPAPELDQVFSHALARELDDRFACGRNFAEELARAIAQLPERGETPSLPEPGRVLGRADSTSTMRSAVVSRPLDGKKAPSARALLLGAGALGVVGVIAWTLSSQPPAPAATQAAASLGSRTEQPAPSSSVGKVGSTTASVPPSERTAPILVPSGAPPKPVASAARARPRTDRPSPAPQAPTDPVFGLEVPSGL